MSIHSSLKASTAAGQRNVWTRVERINALKQDGRWTPEAGVTGLPKVRTKFKSLTEKKKKKEKEAATEAETATEAATENAEEKQ